MRPPLESHIMTRRQEKTGLAVEHGDGPETVDHRLLAQFWDDCRAAGPLRVRTELPRGASAAPGGRDLPHPFAVIGRDPKDDARLGHEDVSRHHLYLQVIDGRVCWLDLGSRAGTSQDDVIVPSGWLDPGDSIGLGPYLVRAEVGAGGASPPTSLSRHPTSDRGPSTWPDASLEFRGRPEGPTRRRISRVLTLVGRASDCRFRIPDDAISRYHCALLRTPGGLWAVDLLSREGIRVDGARVRFAKLGDGATLHVGRYRMVARQVDAETSNGEVPGDAPSWDLPTLAPEQLPAVAAPRRPPDRVVAVDRVEPPSASLTPADLEPFVARFEQMQRQMFEQFHQAMMAMFQTFGDLHRDQMGQAREEFDRIRDLTRELQTLQAGPSKPSSKPSAEPDQSPMPRARPEVGSEPPPLRMPTDPKRTPAGPEVHDLIRRRITQIQEERQGRWKRVLDLVSGGS